VWGRPLDPEITGSAYYRSGYIGYPVTAVTIPWIEGWRGVDIGPWPEHLGWAFFPGLIAFMISGAVWCLRRTRFDVRAYALGAVPAGLANELLVQFVAGVTKLDAPPPGRFFAYGLGGVLVYWVIFELTLLLVRLDRRPSGDA
jgi:hypothetical protein